MQLKNPARYVSIAILVVYIFLLLKLVVFKGGLSELTEHFSPNGVSPVKPLKPNFIPFRSIYYYLSLKEPVDVAIRNVLGNIILFIPYGLILPVAFQTVHRFSSLFFTILCTSLFFEILQWITKLGSFDVDDLILNTLGGLLGWLIYILLRKIQF